MRVHNKSKKDFLIVMIGRYRVEKYTTMSSRRHVSALIFFVFSKNCEWVWDLTGSRNGGHFTPRYFAPLQDENNTYNLICFVTRQRRKMEIYNYIILKTLRTNCFYTLSFNMCFLQRLCILK